jgi:3-hydroxymyristoyl/3-hydroxydecanoyl-(acyl carrier protein) dehydratase
MNPPHLLSACGICIAVVLVIVRLLALCDAVAFVMPAGAARLRAMGLIQISEEFFGGHFSRSDRVIIPKRDK